MARHPLPRRFALPRRLDVEQIHGNGGNTVLVWIDRDPGHRRRSIG